MKNTYIITLFLCFFEFTYSQEQITNYLTGASSDLLNDTELLLEGYMAPVGKWFGTGLNAGWYNTGQPHQFPGFDITAGFHVITPSKNALYYKPNLESLVLNGNEDLSTILGPSNNSIEVLYDVPGSNNNEQMVLFNTPGGVNWDGALLMPYLQGSIGLIRKTEILFRYAPRVNLKKLNTGFWGVGIKHDIKQWIPGIKLFPFNLSWVAAYSKLNSDYSFNEPNQNLIFDVKAFNSTFVLSKKLAFFTPYLGVGYQYSNANLALTGNYIINNWNNDLMQIEEGTNYEISNPFNLSFGGVNGLKATMGARIKLLIFTIHVDWTKAEYDVFTIGFGLNSDLGSRLIGGQIDKKLIN